MQTVISLHFVDTEERSVVDEKTEEGVLRDIASKNRANNEAQYKTVAGREGDERENNGKAECPYDEIGDQKMSKWQWAM